MPDPDTARADSRTRHLRDVLDAAGQKADIPVMDAELIRDGANALYRLPDGVVARIGPPGTFIGAERQIHASRWLAEADIPVVRALDGIDQPTVIDDQPVTWWEELPEHRHATSAELGAVLKRLHALPIPERPAFPTVDPFEGLAEAIEAGAALPAHDRTWLTGLAERLRAEYSELAPSLPRRIIHGDAWQGNVVVPVSGGSPVLLDLDHVGTGPREWDLVSLAVDFTDFARVPQADYDAFVSAYGGYDMTASPGYRTLATTRELRWTAFVLGKADTSQQAVREVRHRVACLRGQVSRPWTWSAF